jgi:short-subunit dehydrogenase
MNSLHNKNIIITGASSGIGKALAIEAALCNANIVLASRQIEKLEKLKTEIKTKNSKIICVKTDVTNLKDCENLIHQTIKHLGGIDILINNAGISMRAPFENVQLSVLEEIMNVNYWGSVYCTRAALPELIKNKGSLVAVSSVTGFKGLPGRTGYASSKFAINGLFESIRMEYMNRGLHTLIACPGFTSSDIRKNARIADGTKQINSPGDETRMDRAQDVARDILQAIRDRKDFMLTNRQGKKIYWINKFFPKFLERKIHDAISKEPNSPIKH